MRSVIKANQRSTWFSHEPLVSKVEMKPFMLLGSEPTLQPLPFMSIVVVHDQMNIQVERDF